MRRNLAKARYPEEFQRCFKAIYSYGVHNALPHRLDEMERKVLHLIYLKEKTYYHFFKRCFDLIATAFILILLSPIFILISLGCALTIKGPIFYKQLRVGQGGRLFWLYKFRSLHINHAKNLKENNPFIKIHSKENIGAFSHLIRNYKLDELAQLINVIKGDMSLVGPRPFSVEDTVFISDKYNIRFYPKPGMTGLWQSRFSSKSSPRAKIIIDCLYVRKASFLLDLNCLWRTVGIVVMGEERAPIYPDPKHVVTPVSTVNAGINTKKAS